MRAELTTTSTFKASLLAILSGRLIGFVSVILSGWRRRRVWRYRADRLPRRDRKTVRTIWHGEGPREGPFFLAIDVELQ